MGQLSQKWAVINKMWAVVCKLYTACCAWQPQTDPSGRPFWHFRNNSLGTHFKWMHDSNTEGNASNVRSYVTSAWMHQLPSTEDCCRNVLPLSLTPKSGSQGWAYSSGHWASCTLGRSRLHHRTHTFGSVRGSWSFQREAKQAQEEPVNANWVWCSARLPQ